MCLIRMSVKTQPYTTQHNLTQHKTTQHNTTQHNTTLNNTIQPYTTQHNTTKHNFTQHNTAQPYTSQHNTTLHNTTHIQVVQVTSVVFMLRNNRNNALIRANHTVFTLKHYYTFGALKGPSSGGSDTFHEQCQQNRCPDVNIILKSSVLYVTWQLCVIRYQAVAYYTLRSSSVLYVT